MIYDSPNLFRKMRTDNIIQVSNASGGLCGGLTALYGWLNNIDPATLIGVIGLILSVGVNFYFNLKKTKNEKYRIDEEIKLKKIELEKKLSIDLEIKELEMKRMKEENERLNNFLMNKKFEEIEKEK